MESCEGEQGGAEVTVMIGGEPTMDEVDVTTKFGTGRLGRGRLYGQGFAKPSSTSDMKMS